MRFLKICLNKDRPFSNEAHNKQYLKLNEHSTQLKPKVISNLSRIKTSTENAHTAIMNNSGVKFFTDPKLLIANNELSERSKMVIKAYDIKLKALKNKIGKKPSNSQYKIYKQQQEWEQGFVDAKSATDSMKSSKFTSQNTQFLLYLNLCQMNIN